MDGAGRFNMQYNLDCLRKHFTTRWGVLEDQVYRGEDVTRLVEIHPETGVLALGGEGLLLVHGAS